MKKTYGFLYKTLATLLCTALSMAAAYLMLGIIYAQEFPGVVTIPFLFREEQDIALVMTAVAALCIFGCLAYLLHAAGRRDDEPGFHDGWQEKIPLDLYLTGSIMLGGAGFAAIVELSYRLDMNLNSVLMIGVPIVAVIALLCIGLLTTLAVRLKLGGWWKNTVCYWCLRLIWRIWLWFWGLCKRGWKAVGDLMANLPTIWPVALCSGAFLMVVFFMGAYQMYNGLDTFLWFLLCAALFLGCCYGAVQFNAIRKATEQIAAGKLDAKVDDKRMLPLFRRLAASINSISVGMAAAVEERMKSERLKAELITNVSHDLKTPLTSIINYVDLLSKEELANEKAKEYVWVLSRQAHRLKKLTEDLVEASKASTGNVSAERTRTDVAELLDQCRAEYEERMDAASLAMVCNAQKGLYAMADGRLMWRVFDNLLGNACKYAQPGTRVYLTAKEAAGKARMEIKNISREVLNVSADELLERFVRGDSSRTAEGSGLGLSIAQSLTQINGGSLELYVDGDLFKAVVDLELA